MSFVRLLYRLFQIVGISLSCASADHASRASADHSSRASADHSSKLVAVKTIVRVPIADWRALVCLRASRLQALSLSVLSGWRDRDSGRIAKLTADFRGGKWNLTITGSPWVLEDTDVDGKLLLDDGYSTLSALSDLKQEYQESPTNDPVLQAPWDSRLVEVVPLSVAPLLGASLGSWFRQLQLARRRGFQRILLTIGRFLLGPRRAHCGETFVVSATSLCCVGHSDNWDVARGRRKQLFGMVEGRKRDLAAVCVGSARGYVVEVRAVSRRFSQQRLAASLDMDPTWHSPDESRRHCYHVVRYGHRFRFLCPPEACCEAWGSLVHILFDDMRNASIERVVARLFLKEAQLQCAGSARDDAVVEVRPLIALVHIYLVHIVFCRSYRHDIAWGPLGHYQK